MAGLSRQIRARGEPLPPVAHADFFVCDIFDALPKDDLGSMEHPMFSLSTRPDLRILTYVHNGAEITVTPSVKGLATIHDKDILIFCISQLMAAYSTEAAMPQMSRGFHTRESGLSAFI